MRRFKADAANTVKFLLCFALKNRFDPEKTAKNGGLCADSSYESISTQAALVLKSCANIGIKINQKEEKTNMCKAIQELQDEAVEKACKAIQELQDEAVGIAVKEAVGIAVAENTVNSLLKTAKALMETLHLPAEQVLKAMKLSESECAALKPMLQTQ